MSIQEITKDQLRRMGNQEGLILQGCGGDLQDWVNGINVIALCLALLLCLSFPISASAVEQNVSTIDTEAKGSLTIYKIDLTNAEKDGVWDSSYVSTGIYDQDVYDALIGATRAGDTDDTSDLGNGENSH